MRGARRDPGAAGDRETAPPRAASPPTTDRDEATRDASAKTNDGGDGADEGGTRGTSPPLAEEAGPPPPTNSTSGPSRTPASDVAATAASRRKLLLLAPLLLCLYLLTDSDYDETTNKKHHLAFVTALARHPPSKRVFRIATEGGFLLACAALALWVWEGGADTGGGRNNSPEHSRDEAPIDRSEAIPPAPFGADNDDLRITPEKVGRLLFARPPDSITTNAAWVVYRRHRSFRRRKRQKRRSSRNIENDNPREDNGVGSGHESGAIDETAIERPPLPPFSSSVLGAALDVFTVTCAFLILFTVSSSEGGRYIDQNNDNNSRDSWMKFVAKIAAPIFPLTLFLLAVLAITLPWYKRKSLFTIVSLTIGAPFYEVTFRDGFIGDILTSTVRPLQDLAFTAFFLPSGLRAWWGRDQYTADAAGVPLERSWMLHTVVLPACTLSPQWWRFLQNLRQCYDSKQRWPYLGNALKYLLAAEVAILGVFDPSVKQSPLWIACFLVATLYQVWWDVFMDWGLLERDPNFGGGWFRWWPYSLRSRRLYRRRWAYHLIFVVNFCLRFVGMITLIPPVYLSRSTGLIVSGNDPDFQLFVGSLVASAEIFRRTIWALLRLEWEVIKTSLEHGKNGVVPIDGGHGDGAIELLEEEGMKPMSIASSEMVVRDRRRAWPFAPAGTTFSPASLSDMSNLNDIQILSELSVWATVFSGIAIIAAAHREVL